MALDDVVQENENNFKISLKTSTPLQEKENNFNHFSISPDKSPALYELDKRFMQLNLSQCEQSVNDSVSRAYQYSKSFSKLKTSFQENGVSLKSPMKWPYHDPHNYRIVKNNSSIEDLSKLFKSNMDISSIKSKYSYMGEYFQTTNKIVRKHNVRIRI